MILQNLKRILWLPLCSTAALAADPLTINPESPWYAYDFDSGWHFDLGIGMELEPTYAGSDEYDTEPDVFARAIYRNDRGHRYFVNLGEVGAIYAISPKTQFLAFLEYEEERENDEDPALDGLNEIDSTIEGQFLLAQRFGNSTIFGILQPDLTGDANKGLVWFLGASHGVLSDDKKWRCSACVDISGAVSDFMRS